jgi:tRNA-splicing ligase RtcB
MKVIKDEGSVPIKMWTDGVPVEDGAVEQLRRTAALKFVQGVAVMPDVHVGIGATVGSVIATRHAIIPAAVGVDIGCGMAAARLNISADHLPDNLFAIRSAIEKAVPHGRTDNGGKNDRGAWGELPGNYSPLVETLDKKFAKIKDKYPRLGTGNMYNHLGTLGSGNHFVELCVDKLDNVWVMLHSGSRGPGNRIGQFFIQKAKEEMERWFIHLPDRDLAYLPAGSEYFQDYCDAVSWAQTFAFSNRTVMMEQVMSALRHGFNRPDLAVTDVAVNCHHNYISRERHFGEDVIVTRKGAVSARKGEFGIIPGSMGARSFIVKGKGNLESYHSCSHGAGRKMSRTEAKKTFTLEDHIRATEGVECRKDEDVIDETPMAYKDIEAVMKAQEDLVEVVAELKQVLCVKG